MTEDRKSAVSIESIGAVFRNLANEYVEAHNERPSAHERLWNKIASQTEVPTPQSPPGIRLLEKSRPRRASFLLAALVGLSGLGLAFYVSPFAESDAEENTASNRDAPAVSQLSYTVDGESHGALDDQDGELIASEEKAVKVSLSDASTIALQPHTTLRLSSAAGSDPTSGEALLKEDVAPSSKQMAHSEQTLLSKQVVGRLAQGKMDVNAVRKEGVRYRFHAGPYVVHMIGSAFTLEYKPEGERLHLLAQSGTMTVQSPAGTKTITAGQSLTLSSRDEQAGASNDGNSSSQRGSKAASRAGTSAGQRAVQKAAADVANSKEKSFSDLAAKGEFKQIVAIARSQGLEQVLSTYSARDLQELAQAARYTGQLSLAEKTWRSMRARFAGYSNASNAAFFLGRLAAQRGQHATALAHFNTYLRESPGGVYAAEAWGRKLQVVQSTQGNEAARSLAKQYLAKFPQGAYAKSASELLK